MYGDRQSQDKLQELLRIREKLHSDTFGVVELKKLKLTDEEATMRKERKRLGVTDPRITLEQLGFSAIKNKDNLFHLIRLGKAKIIKIESKGKDQIRIKVETSQCQTISIQHGTLLLPSNDPNNLTQTLIVSDQVRAKLKPGIINDLTVNTLCFNRQLHAPDRQEYLLGNIRCLSHSPKMEQSKVWEITVKKNKEIKLLEQNLKKQDYIALSKQNIFSFFQSLEKG